MNILVNVICFIRFFIDKGDWVNFVIFVENKMKYRDFILYFKSIYLFCIK